MEWSELECQGLNDLIAYARLNLYCRKYNISTRYEIYVRAPGQAFRRSGIMCGLRLDLVVESEVKVSIYEMKSEIPKHPKTTTSAP